MAGPVETLERRLTVDGFVTDFAAITGLTPRFDDEFAADLAGLVDYLDGQELRTPIDRKRRFLGHVNLKFRLNASNIRALYSRAVARGVTFNYPQKTALQASFDLDDEALFRSVLTGRGCGSDLIAELSRLFAPVSETATIEHLRAECALPSKLRREIGARDVAGEIVKAQFAAFMWECAEPQVMHAYFDPAYSAASYRASFWDELQARSPSLFNRAQALHVLRVDQALLVRAGSLAELRDSLTARVAKSYAEVNNYGYFAILIEPLVDKGRDVQWELAADLTLFAEKHQSSRASRGYYQRGRVEAETAAYIPGLNREKAHFEFANEGFTYKDCFVLSPGGSVSSPLRLVLVFQANRRDETLIPCPACRSEAVRGNSYPSLGVRSWECQNPLCPERSKYNRGKRYSFKGLATQQAIEDPRNEIPSRLVRRWNRDVVNDVTTPDLLDMLIRFYSMSGDTVHLFNLISDAVAAANRTLVLHQFDEMGSQRSGFWDSPFFHRYAYVHPGTMSSSATDLGTDGFAVLIGDSSKVLKTIKESTFDAAVTSPPYFNAREYSQWPNMYCYLDDMFNGAREVFRTLRPGALYWYNIFDSFDNENTTVFSAMGQKRMILSAYTVDLFRRVGFDLIGNVVWDKGDIEGKRGFNAGNFSPYYQAPFNCWEHILVFRKPDGATQPEFHSTVWRHPPVFKMVRGQNVHGHSAPFPDDLPEMALRDLPPGSTVLDPFAGSLTTARAAARLGHRSVSIELSEQYCRLGLEMWAQEKRSREAEDAQLRLFETQSVDASSIS